MAEAENIVIEGKAFRLVGKSRHGGVVVYTNGDLYARVGSPGRVARLAAVHKRFNALGFPAPEILGSGEIAAGAYLLEKSLGEKSFSFLFQDDIARTGAVSPDLFEKFLAVTERFARAELRSAATAPAGPPLAALIRPEDLARELPAYGPKILALYDEAAEAVKALPLVLSQGDFCTHNLFPDGVIDFEEAYALPFGYDLVTNIFQNRYFPESRAYEYYQLYRLSGAQEDFYYRRMDALFAAAGLPALSRYRRPFEYCRAVWHTARNESAPRLQAWRYELFKRDYLV